MCKYTPYTVIYKECDQTPKHTEERLYWEYCDKIPGTYNHCLDASRDPERLVGSTRVTGDCPSCAAEKEAEQTEEGAKGEEGEEEEDEATRG
jgi:hypothetical protein